MHEVTLRVVLSEAPGGATHFSLTGEVEPVPCASAAGRLFALLTRWTRAPIEVALCVDGTSQAWSEAWIDALSGVDVGDLEVRFTAAADDAGTPR